MMKHLLHTTVVFVPATDMAPGVAEKPKKRRPLTSEPETPSRARQLHADDAREAGLAEQSPMYGSPKGRPQQARAPPELFAFSIREFCRLHSLTPDPSTNCNVRAWRRR